ncbi:hypothetical protein [Caballeronia terrestris]|nr:hypothetical protein [Caballeronia terrestris]
MLADILQLHPLIPDESGLTSLADFEPFCVYSSCDPDNAWAKPASVSARLAKTCA